MRFQIIRPSERLAQYVKCYWTIDKSSKESDVCERVVPTGTIDLMFHLKNSFHVIDSNNSSFKQTSSFVSGLSTTYSDVTTNGDTSMICVTFHPFGASSFFRFPLLDIENRNISLDCIFGNELNAIEEKLYTAQTLAQRIAIIEAFLLDNLNKVASKDLLLIKSGIQLIDQSRGQMSTVALSDKLCTTPKTLERKFSALVGKTPKQFIKIVRFQNILNTFSSENDMLLTDVAYSNGYFDQSHFIKDFKSFSGYTPKEFFTNHQCQSDYFS